jgi:hypothetical protein
MIKVNRLSDQITDDILYERWRWRWGGGDGDGFSKHTTE